MKTIAPVISLLLLINICLAQNTSYNFVPKWKVGDKKHLQIESVKEAVENGKKEPSELEELEADVEVLKEDADNYYITVSYDNIVYSSTKKFYEKLGEEASAIKKLNLKYKVNKQTGKFELTNWKEAQSFITGSIDQMTKLLKKKVPELGKLSDMVFNPIKKMFDSKESTEGYVSDEIGYLFTAFDKKLSIGDTLTVTQTVPNPFMPTDSISGTTLTFLKSVNTAKQTCEIGGKEIMDLRAFKKMMKEMIGGMAKSFGAADSSAQKGIDEIDNITFDMDISDVLTFNYNTTWPAKYVKTSVVIVEAEGKKARTMVTKTVTFK